MSNINSELLKQRVKEPVRFAFFRDGSLWYQTFDGWEFPIPVADTLNSQGSSPTFNATEKGMLLMRWIRKAMEREAALREEASSVQPPPLQP